MKDRDTGEVRDYERAAIIDSLSRITPQLTDPRTTIGNLLRNAPGVRITPEYARHGSDVYKVESLLRLPHETMYWHRIIENDKHLETTPTDTEFNLRYFKYNSGRHAIQFQLKPVELGRPNLFFTWEGGAINPEPTRIYFNIVNGMDGSFFPETQKLGLGSLGLERYTHEFDLSHKNELRPEYLENVPPTPQGLHYKSFRFDYESGLIGIDISHRYNRTYSITLPMSINNFDTSAIPANW